MSEFFEKLMFWIITVIWGGFGLSMGKCAIYLWKQSNLSFLAFPVLFIGMYFIGLLLFGSWMHRAEIISFVKEKLSDLGREK